MATAPVAIEITARLDKLRAEMAKIPDIGSKEARSLTAGLAKEFRALTKASEEAARSSRATKEQVRSLGDAASRAGSDTMKLAGAASLVSPELGELTRNAGDAFDVLEVFSGAGATAGAAMGLVAVAAAGLGLAYAVLTSDEREAARVAQEVAEAHQALTPITDALRDATIDLDEATGNLTSAQAENVRTQLEGLRLLQDSTKETRARVKELYTEQGSMWTQAVDQIEAYTDATGDWNVVGKAIGFYTRALTTDSADLQVEIDALNGTLREGEATTKDLIVAETGAATAKRRSTEATKAATESERERLAVLEAAEKEIDRQADATRELADRIAGLRAVADDSATSRLSGEAAVAAKLDERLEQLREERDLIIATAGTETQQAAAREAYIDAEVELTRTAQEEITKIRETEAEKRADIAAKEAEVAKRNTVQTVQSTADLMGAIGSLAANVTSGLTEDQKEAAKALFAVQLAAGISQATINAALAVSEASTLPYPANLVAMAAAGVAGAANIAAVASTPPPRFSDTPGPQKMGNGVGPTTATFSAGDYVVASRTREGLKAQVDPYANRTDGAAYTVINRRSFGRTVRDDVRVNSPLARQTAESSTVMGYR